MSAVIEKLGQTIAEKIATHGQFIMGVASDPAFFYTIGNHLKGLPELILVGNFRLDSAGSLLNDLGEAQRESHKPLAEGEIWFPGGKFPLLVRKVSSPGVVRSDYSIQAGQYFGTEDYDVLQIVLCDKTGKWPGEPDIDPNFKVPLL